MTDIDHNTAIGIIHTIKEYLPPNPPEDYTPEQRAAYYVGWRECAQHFEDSSFRAITEEADRVNPERPTTRKARRVDRSEDHRWNCAVCGHPQAEHQSLREECWHVTLEGKEITDRCGCPTFETRPDYPVLTRSDPHD